MGHSRYHLCFGRSSQSVPQGVRKKHTGAISGAPVLSYREKSFQQAAQEGIHTDAASILAPTGWSLKSLAGLLDSFIALEKSISYLCGKEKAKNEEMGKKKHRSRNCCGVWKVKSYLTSTVAPTSLN